MRDYLTELGKEGKGKIKVLDSGAGEGYAVDTLLCSEFGPQIKKVTGVSLHSFNHVKEVLEKHKRKVEWYLGDAFTVLKKLPAEYDLVTDVNGTFLYCEEKIKLIKAIHDILKIGGRAYIFRNRDLHDNLIDEEGERDRMENVLESKYPDTFKFFNLGISHRTVLLITKTSKRCPPLDYELDASFYSNSVHRRITKAEAIRGNAWYPEKVIFKRTSSSRSLRTLDCEPETKRSKI
jgi:SAM-dependent methyltransferase